MLSWRMNKGKMIMEMPVSDISEKSEFEVYTVTSKEVHGKIGYDACDLFNDPSKGKSVFRYDMGHIVKTNLYQIVGF